MDWKNNKLIFIVIAFAVFNLVFIVGYKLIVKQVTNEVIQTLQKGYSPGQAYPGIDPDKIVPNKTLLDELERRQMNNQRVFQEDQPMQQDMPRPELVLESNLSTSNGIAWRHEWEKERGAAGD